MGCDNREDFHFVPRIVNAGIAGVIGVACTFPLDLVKTRWQNQEIGGGKKIYSSLRDALKKTISNEGIRGCYRGSGVNMLLITPEKAIKLVANDYFRYFLTTPDGCLPFYREVMAGAGAGTCQIIVTTPMELLKIQLQDAGRGGTMNRSQQSASKVALKLIRERGLTGLYKGTGATFLRDCTFSMIYFPLFANLNALGRRRPEAPDETIFVDSFFAGLAAATCGSFCVTPLDVVKTQLQSLNRLKGEKTFNGVWDTIKHIWHHQGFRGYFKGGAARCMVKRFLTSLHHNRHDEHFHFRIYLFLSNTFYGNCSFRRIFKVISSSCDSVS
ncbi:hypothetical protein SNEBB_000620 [Seison nebaliae]|nr:hypothetical protein SNEBB_000620 [Seison nebaliae]